MDVRDVFVGILKKSLVGEKFCPEYSYDCSEFGDTIVKDVFKDEFNNVRILIEGVTFDFHMNCCTEFTDRGYPVSRQVVNEVEEKVKQEFGTTEVDPNNKHMYEKIKEYVRESLIREFSRKHMRQVYCNIDGIIDKIKRT